MGNLEKLVLLVLLFGAAVVLALTLNKSKAGDAGSGPLDAAQAKLGERAPERVVHAAETPAVSAAPAQTPDLLLNAGDAGERSTGGLEMPLAPAEPSTQTVATPAAAIPAPEAPNTTAAAPAPPIALRR